MPPEKDEISGFLGPHFFKETCVKHVDLLDDLGDVPFGKPGPFTDRSFTYSNL